MGDRCKHCDCLESDKVHYMPLAYPDHHVFEADELDQGSSQAPPDPQEEIEYLKIRVSRLELLIVTLVNNTVYGES